MGDAHLMSLEATRKCIRFFAISSHNIVYIQSPTFLELKKFISSNDDALFIFHDLWH